MIRLRIALLAATISIASLLPHAAAADPKIIAYGKHLSNECTTCHRLDGTDNGIPSIIGWEAHLFTQALASFKKGERTNPAMVSVANSLDDEQIAALAAYFGSLKK